MEFKKEKLFWIFKPKELFVSNEKITIKTEPKTDFWQRTYYGFRNDNAPAILIETTSVQDKFPISKVKHFIDKCLTLTIVFCIKSSILLKNTHTITFFCKKHCFCSL